MAFTPPPTPPNSGDPANFNSRADAMLGWLPTHVAELNATGWPSSPVLAQLRGSAAVPAWAFEADPDTGMWSPGANILAWSTGGVERLRLSSTGLLTSPTAIVTSDSDTTAGRLMTTGAGPAQAFRRGNILGPVSQSSGVPTGAIIETGSNANGSWERRAGGMLTCTAVVPGAIAITAAIGGLYRSDEYVWNFPATFISAPNVTASVRQASAWANGRGADGTSGRVRGYSTEILAGASIEITATGRWHA